MTDAPFESDALDLGGPTPFAQVESWLERRCDLERTWHSRWAELRLYRPTSGDGPSVVVKRSSRWQPGDARSLHELTERCTRQAREAGRAPYVAESLWWGSDPEYAATTYIDAVMMSDWVADAWASDGPAALPRTLEACTGYARTLARFHLAQGPQDAPAARGEHPVFRVLASAAARSRVRWVSAIEDPGPHNAMVDAGGQVWLVDLPTRPVVTFVEHDLGMLATRLVAALQRGSGSRYVPRLGHYRKVIDAVVDGYRAEAGDEIPIDRSLVVAQVAANAVTRAVRTKDKPLNWRIESTCREGLASVALVVGALAGRFRPAR